MKHTKKIVRDVLSHMSHPDEKLYFTGIITGDYQTRTRWGWMGFENQYWTNFKEHTDSYYNKNFLTAGNNVINVEHWHEFFSGSFINVIPMISDYKRKLGNWEDERNANYVLASGVLRTYACNAAKRHEEQYGRIGFSIEHGGRKPNRSITACAVTYQPWNKDCWAIFRTSEEDGKTKMIYPSDMSHYQGKNISRHVSHLPEDVLKMATKMHNQLLDGISNNIL